MVRKITFIATSQVDDLTLERNAQHSSRLGYPLIGEAGPVAPNLAVVGGSPSVVNHIEELKAWDGEIWATNGAYIWCLGNGIEATFYTIDPSIALAPIAAKANRAILSSICDPAVFDAVKGPIEIFPKDELPNGSSGVATAPMVAAKRGHTSVTFFGCESSFEGQEHAYSWSHKTDSRLIVECGGEEYMTTPQLIMQAEYLAEIARNVPGFIKVAGSGFLPALIEHGDYEVLKVSRNIMESLTHGN